MRSKRPPMGVGRAARRVLGSGRETLKPAASAGTMIEMIALSEARITK
jgi:hypothetical protein